MRKCDGESRLTTRDVAAARKVFSGIAANHGMIPARSRVKDNRILPGLLAFLFEPVFR